MTDLLEGKVYMNERAREAAYVVVKPAVYPLTCKCLQFIP